jgi:hypothetical protein
MIVQNTESDSDCVSQIPWLSVGAHQGRGNATAVADINLNLGIAVKDRVTFGYEVLSASVPVGGWGGVMFMVKWGSPAITRMFQLPLYRAGVLSNSGPERSNWNWPLQDSIFFPGAEVIIIPPEDPAVISNPACSLNIARYQQGDIGTTKNYDFRLSKVIDCAFALGKVSGTKPTGTIPVQGLHFYTENAGDSGYLWTMVEKANVIN